MLYSKEHNACIYDVPNPLLIGNCIPDARLLSPTQVAVPCTIPNMQAMRQLGHEATSPILWEYNYPIKPPLKPFEHQLHMAAFMTLHKHCFNLSDMGTGKTLGLLWAADYLMQKGYIKKVIILAPLSTLTRVWLDEIFKAFMGRRKAIVVYGSREKRLQLLKQDADFYIINHDGVGVGSSKKGRGFELGDIGVYLRDNPDFNAVIVDEGSVYKDHTTDRYKAMRQALSHKEYFWWATGTPVPVEPPNAWSQARAVRSDYGESYQSFRERTMYKVTQFKWAPRKGSNELAASILQPAIRYSRDECLDLPEVMIEDWEVELSPTQQAAYNEIKKTLKVEIGTGQITAINEAALRTKLIQIACGAVYGADHEVNKIDCKPRLDALHEVIEQAGRKILVFAPLTSVINLLYNEFKTKYSCAKVTGNVSSKQRDAIFQSFQNDADPRIIFADPGCMAHGLTLTAAATTVWYGPTDKPEVYQQANKRMDRPGQTSSMLIVRFSATRTEREIFKRLDNRGSMQGLILDFIKGE